jgi:hypothetical protein
MPWIVDNDYTELLQSLRDEVIATSAETGDITPAVWYSSEVQINGFRIQAYGRYSMGGRCNRLQFKVFWLIDGKRRGYNYTHGRLRRG